MDSRRRQRPHDRQRSTRRERQRAACAVPAKVYDTLGIDECGLTKEQRSSLFGPGEDEEGIHATLTAASAGVAVLACQHIARRLMIDGDAKRLTRRDLLAIRMAPQIAAEVKRRSTKPDPPPHPSGVYDPIVALLEGTTEEETVRAENKR